jgi:Flp pilus assembly pilin Flp
MYLIIALQAKLRQLISQLGRRVRRIAGGQTMTEYALILAAVAIVAYVTYQTLGTEISTLISDVTKSLSNAASSGSGGGGGGT